MNGRELDAYDIEFNYHRMLGMGSGFTEPSPHVEGFLEATTIESVEATDVYTVVFKLRDPRLSALKEFLSDMHTAIYPPEVIEQYGDAKDWRNLVGTGPFEIVDFVDGSSLTWEKNSNYWGYDEKYPENRLPYVDKVENVIIEDAATRLSALRTGKVDYVGFIGCGFKLHDVFLGS